MGISLKWSQQDPKWVEIWEENQVVDEIQVSFPLKKLPSTLFLSTEEAKVWLVEKERKMAKYLALYYLARQALASTILLQKIQAKGYSARVANEVVASCQPYLSDDTYWPRIVEKELARGYGPRLIVWKWKAKGLPEHFVRQIATPDKQKEGMKKLRSKWTDRKKAFRYLLQRGFDAEVIEVFLRMP